LNSDVRGSAPPHEDTRASRAKHVSLHALESEGSAPPYEDTRQCLESEGPAPPHEDTRQSREKNNHASRYALKSEGSTPPYGKAGRKTITCLVMPLSLRALTFPLSFETWTPLPYLSRGLFPMSPSSLSPVRNRPYPLSRKLILTPLTLPRLSPSLALLTLILSPVLILTSRTPSLPNLTLTHSSFVCPLTAYHRYPLQHQTLRVLHRHQALTLPQTHHPQHLPALRLQCLPCLLPRSHSTEPATCLAPHPPSSPTLDAQGCCSR
jgi:hypothetical protein